jgi:hypothetical protein
MRRNVVTSLRRRRAPPMAGFDRLPPPLRRWLHHAAVPWSVDSVLRLWQRALAEAGSEAEALARLDAAEARALARDAARLWGPGHPAAAPRVLSQSAPAAAPAGLRRGPPDATCPGRREKRP